MLFRSTNSGRQTHVQNGWKELMGDNVLFAENQDDIAKLIAETTLKHKYEAAGGSTITVPTGTTSIEVEML